MKKIIASVICLTVIISCLAACGTKVKGGEVVTNSANEPVAIVTDENGGAKRDDNGNLVVLVTDENGKNVKDKNGELATQAMTIKHVLLMGDTAETQYFSIKIPQDWTYSTKSFSNVILYNDKGDKIFIRAYEGKTATDLLQKDILMSGMDSEYPDSRKTNTSVTLGDGTAPYVARYIEKDKNGEQTFAGFIFFEHEGIGFSCMITGKRDVEADIDDIVTVLNTIQYK